MVGGVEIGRIKRPPPVRVRGVDASRGWWAGP